MTKRLIYNKAMMAQLSHRPSFAAALSSWRFHFFCHQRPRTFLPLRIQRFHSILPPILSNEKLPFRVQFGAVHVPRRDLCFRAATGVSDSGDVDSNLIRSMEKKIKEHLTAESVSVKDAYGDGRHVSINVISTAFEGQSAVNRQRMVYKAIWEELQNTVHAVDQMTTMTPAEASNTK